MNITAGKTAKLIDLLLEEFGSASKTKVKKFITNGSIRCNGKIVKRCETIVNQGDNIEYTKYKEDVNKVRPPYPILFEDDYLVAINKPAGALMHGETGQYNESVIKAMSKYVRESSKGKKQALIIHRLDREVAGIVVLAKSEEILNRMKDNWHNNEKLYFALVEGSPKVKEGSITSWIGDDFQQKVKSVPEGTPDAKLAITHYRTLNKYDNNTLLEVKLETGRKNQIRLHFSEMGCPIVGDRRYGADATFVRQIRLFAFSLSFTHPVTNEKQIIELPMPQYFLKLKEADEKYK